MINILLSAYCISYAHKNICAGIIDMFSNDEYFIDILSNVTLNSLFAQQSQENILINNYDAVISFNKRGYQFISKHLKNRHIPNIYIFCNSEITSEYIYNIEAFSHIIIINDDSKQIPHIFSGEYITRIDIPFQLPNKTRQFQNIIDKQILVHISDNEALLTIIPVLNNLQDREILIVNDKNNIKPMLQSNIKCLKKSQIDISDQINKSNLIIGDGSTILNGLLLLKTCVVVGSRGLGGLITNDNIEIQFKSGFQGRVGAERGEYIPQSLFFEEIQRGLKNSKYDNEFFSSFLEHEYKKITSILHSIIHKSISLRSSKIWNLKFRKSKQFGYYKKNDSESILIIDQSFNKMLCLINQEEFSIIECFKKAVTPLEIFNALDLGNTNDYDNFINELISNKLIYNDET